MNFLSRSFPSSRENLNKLSVPPSPSGSWAAGAVPIFFLCYHASSDTTTVSDIAAIARAFSLLLVRPDHYPFFIFFFKTRCLIFPSPRFAFRLPCLVVLARSVSCRLLYPPDVARNMCSLSLFLHLRRPLIFLRSVHGLSVFLRTSYVSRCPPSPNLPF